MNDLINMIFFVMIFVLTIIYFRDLNYTKIVNSIRNV